MCYIYPMRPTNEQIDDELSRIENSCLKEKRGGPFGAFIFDKSGNIVASAQNAVIAKNDPTAHAEIEAIRAACAKLGTYDLSGYSIYASGYPCPMCMAAILWAKIDALYYSASYADAEKIGFRDDFISAALGGGKNSIEPKLLKIERIKSERLDRIYASYAKIGKVY